MLKPTEVRAVSAEFLDAGGVVGVFEADFEIEEVSKPEFVELARLFHAAPAMYEALGAAVNHCDECGGEGKIRYYPLGEKNWEESKCLVCKPWRDALKAAEGRCTNE
jgi:hypothetical protein